MRYGVIVFFCCTLSACGLLSKRDEPNPPAVNEDDPRPLAEQIPAFPSYPQDGRLKPFFVSSASDNRFYIDPASLKISEDGIVYYTLVIASPSNARTISFEGIRCNSKEFRRYATGQAGQWVRSRISAWQPIEYKDLNRHHATLFRDVLCDGAKPVNTERDILEGLQRTLP